MHVKLSVAAGRQSQSVVLNSNSCPSINMSVWEYREGDEYGEERQKEKEIRKRERGRGHMERENRRGRRKEREVKLRINRVQIQNRRKTC